jgi:hypothetical protein
MRIKHRSGTSAINRNIGRLANLRASLSLKLFLKKAAPGSRVAYITGMYDAESQDSTKLAAALGGYCTCMEEIKLRVESIRAIVAKRVTTLYPVTNVEFVYLQLRKILELIALASLVANKAEYAKVHKKFASHWHAKKILDDIGKVNPLFYPVPTREIIDPTTGKVKETQPLESGFLTKDDFIELYDTSSKVLHAHNPFAPPQDIVALEQHTSGWMEKIVTLLNHHQVQLFDLDMQLWVLMHGKDDGKVHGMLFRKVQKSNRGAAIQPAGNRDFTCFAASSDSPPAPSSQHSPQAARRNAFAKKQRRSRGSRS